MDLNITASLCSNSKTTVNAWRLAISLVIAVAVHIGLLIIPMSIAPDTSPGIASPLEINLLANKKIEVPRADDTELPPSHIKPQELEGYTTETTGNNVIEVTPSTPNINGGSITNADSSSTISKQIDQPQNPDHLGMEKPTPTLEASGDSEARSQPTVFDPVLERKLAQQRNRVRRLERTEAMYTTTTGTFVEVGDRCFNVKDLPPGNTNSDLNPWFRAKCPDNSRSKAEIDRLAEKYGIP
ncbi:hypothetical protein ACJJJB_08295 [Microbulbifer sp. ANSA001]|uniref:hypothetical protein n=1 Tax=Microbulbifer sp. ANSA001 TaxID=3243358 RepID=UPI004041F332